MMIRRGLAAACVLAAAATAAGVAPAAGPHVCSGKFGTPGLLRGTYPNGVVAKGVCAVKTGKAHVIGTLTVTKGSALAASFGGHHSALTVTGNLVVDQGGTVFLGCGATKEDACINETNMSHPTLTSRATVTGDLIENSPLGVVAHNATIGGNVKESRGGGGLSCAPPKSGIFASIMSPVYSDYEDSSLGKNVTISGLNTCWVGLARVKIHGSLTVSGNTLGDPDGVEIVSNTIGKNLACRGNGHPAGGPPGTMPVWDSAETTMNGAIYPRASKPNKVGGKRSGQCVTASPTTLGGPPAASAF